MDTRLQAPRAKEVGVIFYYYKFLSGNLLLGITLCRLTGINPESLESFHSISWKNLCYLLHFIFRTSLGDKGTCRWLSTYIFPLSWVNFRLFCAKMAYLRFFLLFLSSIPSFFPLWDIKPRKADLISHSDHTYQFDCSKHSIISFSPHEVPPGWRNSVLCLPKQEEKKKERKKEMERQRETFLKLYIEYQYHTDYLPEEKFILRKLKIQLELERGKG